MIMIRILSYETESINITEQNTNIDSTFKEKKNII